MYVWVKGWYFYLDKQFQIYSKAAIFGQPITLEARLNCRYGLQPLEHCDCWLEYHSLHGRMSPQFCVCCLPGILSEILAIDQPSFQAFYALSRKPFSFRSLFTYCNSTEGLIRKTIIIIIIIIMSIYWRVETYVRVMCNGTVSQFIMVFINLGTVPAAWDVQFVTFAVLYFLSVCLSVIVWLAICCMLRFPK
jgi:hypothetical protein